MSASAAIAAAIAVTSSSEPAASLGRCQPAATVAIPIPDA